MSFLCWAVSLIRAYVKVFMPLIYLCSLNGHYLSCCCAWVVFLACFLSSPPPPSCLRALFRVGAFVWASIFRSFLCFPCLRLLLASGLCLVWIPLVVSCSFCLPHRYCSWRRSQFFFAFGVVPLRCTFLFCAAFHRVFRSCCPFFA